MGEEISQHIGHRIRAARARLGWSRETLGSRSGVSWAAITQMESGRRRNTRSDTLLALSRALEVTIEYLVGVGTELPRMFGHEACAYSSDEEMVRVVTSFIMEGLDRDEGVLVSMPEAKLDLVTGSLSSRATDLVTVNAAKFYGSPQGYLSMFRTFVEEQATAGRPWARIVAEPPWLGKTPPEEQTIMIVESILEVSFSSLPVTMLCPYDKQLVGKGALAAAEKTHPHIRAESGVEPNTSYEDPGAVALRSLPEELSG